MCGVWCVVCGEECVVCECVVCRVCECVCVCVCERERESVCWGVRCVVYHSYPGASHVSHARPFVGVSQSQCFRDLVNFWR